jgi:hypothetical protein
MKNGPSEPNIVDQIGQLLLRAAIGNRPLEDMRRVANLLQKAKRLQGDDWRMVTSSGNPSWVDSLLSYRAAQASVFNAADFVSAPGPSPLTSLRSFSVYGLDFKIDPHGDVKLIEANGINSGMSGFAATRSNALAEANQLYRADRALEHHLHLYGSKHLAMIGTLLCQFGMERFRLPIIKDLCLELLKVKVGLNPAHKIPVPHQDWQECASGFASHIFLLECVLSSKSAIDAWLEPVRQYKPRSYHFNEEGIAEFKKNEKDARYAVLKPDDGGGGQDVTVIPASQLTVHIAKPPLARLIEPFVESTPIFCDKTLRTHDGCMRLVVVAERGKDGSLAYRHFGGYWRLCPLPIESYGELNAMRANLCQGAIALSASDSHLSMVRPVAEQVIGVIEDRLHGVTCGQGRSV